MRRPPPTTRRLPRGPLPACLATWALVAAPGPAAAEPIRLGCVEFPPYSYTDATGHPAGTLLELAARLFGRLQLEWRAECYPGARLMVQLREGGSDVAMLIRHPDVIDHTYYGELPLLHLDLEAYRLADRPPLGGMEGLRGRSAILLRGYGYGGWSDFLKDPANAITFTYADSHSAAFRMLANGHGDYLIDYDDPARAALAETPMPGVRSEVLGRLPVYLVVSKKTPDGERLLERLEDAVTEP